MTSRFIAGASLVLSALVAAHPTFAADQLKVAISHKSSWDAIFTSTGVEKGFFKEVDLEIAYSYTAGGAETVQAVSTGSVDVVTPTSIHAVLTAYVKGAPIRIIGSQMIGSPDIFWYVPKDSPIKRPEDINGKKVGYSRPASVTHMLLQNFVEQRKLTATLISAGGLPASRTMLMTGQIDVGWSAVPFALDLVRSGEVRILFTGDNVEEAKAVVSRVNATSANTLKTKRDALKRFTIAYLKSVDYVYGANREAAVKQFATENQMDFAVADDAVRYFGKDKHAVAPIRGLDVAVKQAIQFGLIKEPLTEAQVKELVDIVYDPGAK